MKSRRFSILLFLLITASASSQTGGDNIYEFLNLTHSGLISSLGGSNVSLPSEDLNTSWHNPALLNREMDRSLALNYVNYFAGINYGLAMYSCTIRNANIAGGISYLNYGTFTEADESGNITGTFKASEAALSFMYSRPIDSAFSAGINFKPVISDLERYNSLGFAFDIGASWQNTTGIVSAGIVLRNIGYQLTRYADEERGKLPFEILAGITVKPQHAPFRLSFTLRHLEKYNLTYQYLTQEDNTNNSEFLDNLMRHVIIGTEIIPHKNFYLSAGYNHQRKSELGTGSKSSGSGFSWGFGINTSGMILEFGRASYHLAGSSTHFSVIIKTGKFLAGHYE